MKVPACFLKASKAGMIIVTLNSKSVTEIDNKLPDNLNGARFCLL
jgi:hypothetical protein